MKHNFRRYEQLVKDAQMTIVTLASCQIVHIYREANFVAHGLAKTAIKQVIYEIWLEKFQAASVILFC